jgi:hypothetical protein
MGIPVPLFWLRTFYVEFRWSPDEVHLESRYIEYKYANSSIFQVDSRWTPDGYWSPAGVHLNSVGECKVYALFIAVDGNFKLKGKERNLKDVELMPGWGAYVPQDEYQTHIANYVDEPEVGNSAIYLNIQYSTDF